MNKHYVRIAEDEFPLTPKRGVEIPSGETLNLVFVTLCAFRPQRFLLGRPSPNQQSLTVKSFKTAHVENFIGEVPLGAVVFERLDLATIVPKTINHLTFYNPLGGPVTLHLALRGCREESAQLFKKLRYHFESGVEGMRLTVMEKT